MVKPILVKEHEGHISEPVQGNTMEHTELSEDIFLMIISSWVGTFTVWNLKL